MKKVLSTSAVLIFLTIITRIMGFLREVFIAYYFGTSSMVENYVISQTVGELLGNIVLASSFSTFVLITLKKNKFRFGKVASFSFVIALSFSLLIYYFSYAIANILTSNGENLNIEVVNLYITILSPVLVFITMATVYSSYLNFHSYYLQPIISIILMNATFLISMFILFNSNLDEKTILPLSYLFSTITYFFYNFLIYILKNKNIESENEAQISPTVSNLGKLFLPILISIFISKVILITDRFFISLGNAGEIGAYNYAMKLINLPIAILGTALINMMFVNFLKSKENIENEVKYFKLLINFGFIIAIYIFFSAESLVELIFGYGAFGSEAIEETTFLLKWLSMLLPLQFLLLLYQKIAYEYIQSRKIIFITVIILGINLISNFLLIYIFEFSAVLSVIISTYISSAFHVILLIRPSKRIDKIYIMKLLIISIILIVYSKSIVSILGLSYISFFLYTAIYLIITLLFDRLLKFNLIKELVELK